MKKKNSYEYLVHLVSLLLMPKINKITKGKIENGGNAIGRHVVCQKKKMKQRKVKF